MPDFEKKKNPWLAYVVKSQPRKNQSERFYLYPWRLPRHLIIHIRLLLIQFKINLWVLVSIFFFVFHSWWRFFVFQYAIDTETTLTRVSNNGYSIPHPAPVSTYLDIVWSHVFRITSVICDLPIFISHPVVNFKLKVARISRLSKKQIPFPSKIFLSRIRN